MIHICPDDLQAIGVIYPIVRDSIMYVRILGKNFVCFCKKCLTRS
jgi:hypothetical protein